MDRGLILLGLLALVTSGVQATNHLSFANNTAVRITREGCGSTKLCVETPDDCQPNATSTCLFASADTGTPMPPNGTRLSMEVRGDSTGYVALGLTMNATQGTSKLFVCGRNSSNNGAFFFRTMERNNQNNTLTPTERRVEEIRGSVNGSVIRCEFDLPGVNTTSTRNTVMYTILLGNGTFDGGEIGPFKLLLNSGRLNLSDPTSASAPVRPHVVFPLLGVITWLLFRA